MPSHEPAQGALPVPVPVLALVGLVVLCFCTIPAVLEHHRLQQRLRGSQEAAQLAQQDLQRRRTKLRAGPHDAFSRIRRLRELRSQGQRYLTERVVGSPPPPAAPARTRAAKGTVETPPATPSPGPAPVRAPGTTREATNR